MNPIKLFFYNWAFWVRLVFVGIVTGIGVWLDLRWPAETTAHYYMGGFAAFCYLFGDFLTGSGFHARFHAVDAPTPRVVWRIAALVFWLATVALFVGYQA